LRILRIGFVRAGMGLAFSPVPFAQTAQAPTSAKTHAASPAPDLSGVWYIREYATRSGSLSKEGPPFQPWAETEYKARERAKSTNTDPETSPDPTARCIPPGVPRILMQPYPFEILQARDRVVIIFEYQSLVRHIFLDGRKHPKDLDPTYMGHSIGHYEGDTLVVDTLGFNDKTWLDSRGLPHTDALHVVERIRRVDHDTLQDEITIEDSKAYTRAWTAQKFYILKPDWEIQEYVCAENNTYH